MFDGLVYIQSNRPFYRPHRLVGDLLGQAHELTLVAPVLADLVREVRHNPLLARADLQSVRDERRRGVLARRDHAVRVGNLRAVSGGELELLELERALEDGNT